MIRPIGGVILAGAMLAMLACLGNSSDAVVAQEAKAAAPKKDFARTSNFANCLQCHSGGFENADNANEQSYELVTLREANFWNRRDLHSTAWRVLISPLGNRMSQLLGYDVSRAAACLTCHGVDASPTTPLAEKQKEGNFVKYFVTPGPVKPDPKEQEKFVTQSLTYGVSCEGCHGNGKAWYEPHQNPEWRKEEASRKFVEYGLVDLRNPEVRATKCASCHIGNVAEGKLVTHEMYAAGHPPLPAFELATFSRDEPAHYLPPSRNLHFNNIASKGGLDGRDKALSDAWRIYHYSPDEIPSARFAAVGTVVNLREYLKTLALEAATASKESGSLDWTHFNCSACHHDLKYPSSRQQTGYLGKPGRLFPRMWSVTATRAVLEHSSTFKENRIGVDGLPALQKLNGEFDGLVESLLSAFDKQQYGDPKVVQKAADDLVGWCDRFVAVLDRPGLYDRQSATTLAGILQVYAASEKQKIRSRTPFNDFDSAQNLFWAWSAISGELSVPVDAVPLAQQVKKLDNKSNEDRMKPLEWATIPDPVQSLGKVLDIRARWDEKSEFLRMPTLNINNVDEKKEIPAPRSIQELSLDRSKRKATFDSLKFVSDFKGLSVK